MQGAGDSDPAWAPITSRSNTCVQGCIGAWGASSVCSPIVPAVSVLTIRVCRRFSGADQAPIFHVLHVQGSIRERGAGAVCGAFLPIVSALTIRACS
eukprot:scaffold207009_cov22-Tisochrysis_lutea.AAC.1